MAIEIHLKHNTLKLPFLICGEGLSFIIIPL